MKKKKNQAETETRKNKLNIFLGLLVLIPLVLYFRVVNFQFTKFDDTDIIIRHYDTLKDLKNINQTFNHDFYMDTTGTAYYRPLPVISFMIDAQIGGEEPWIYHLTNLILHIITVIVLFFFLQKLRIKKEIAFLLSLFFAIHPLFTNAVAWIPARVELLFVLFSLACFITFIEYYTSNKRFWFFLHSFVFLLALYSKETAIALPILMLSLLYLTTTEKIKLKRIIPFLAVWSILGLLYYYMRNSVIKVNPDPELSGFFPFIKNLPTIPITFGKFFIPYNLSTLPLFDTPSLVLGIILILAFATIIIRYNRSEKRTVLLGIIWFIIFTIPPMFARVYLAEFNFEYSEFRTYLPAIGILIILGILANELPKRFTFNKILKITLPVFLIYGIIAYIHSAVYSDPISFTNSAINASPQNAFALNLRGYNYLFSNNAEQALSDFENAIKICPLYSAPYNNLGILYRSAGDDSQAEYYFSQAIKYDTLYPKSSFLMNNAFISLSAEKISLKKYNEALIVLKKSENVYPNDSKIYNNMGYDYYCIGNQDSALVCYNKAISIDPNSASYYNNRAKVKFIIKDYEGSLKDLNNTLNLDPNLPDAYLNRGKLKIEMNDYTGAISDLDITLNLDSHSAEAYYYRGNAYSRINKPGEAEKDWAEARKLGYKDK
ncbi:MAG: tetratricopeptide repeat protein [Ignavibacteriaceae bacterium]|nr:tetratricopeptide repeat protein [Ignavibacteriaceae bacterium]